MPASQKRLRLTTESKSAHPVAARPTSSRPTRAGANRSPAVPAKLEIEYLDPADLVAYGKNSRTHSEAQIEAIAKSITEFGFTNPVLIDEKRTLIAGHARTSAALKLGVPSIPTITLIGLSAAQRRAYVIADNQLQIAGSAWDLDLLRSELSDLRAGGFDLALTGFSDLDLTDIFSVKAGHVDPDEVPALDPVAIAHTGDVWLLGAHRLGCGDSTDPQIVKAVLGRDKPHLMVTDPPWGVEYDADWRNKRVRKNGKVSNDDRADWGPAWALFPGVVAYIWHAGRRANDVYSSIIQCGFQVRSQIIWAKSNIAIGRGHYHAQHEPCVYAVREGGTGHWQGDRKQSTLWSIDKPQKSETGHSTQKPVECMKRPIENNSKPGEFVYEPFCGSGTTLIAAEMTGRAALCVEISPNYVDMAIRRWQLFSGKQATLQGTKKTFGQIAEDRVGRRE